jgi:gamma-glutamylcyclotransferase (GGCT)/AIG2-like uncharacterized protein YtfP
VVVHPYFAYGSNLDRARLHERVGEARVHGVARLDGQRLAFNKRGRDGSGKANLVTDPLASVWGVVYEIASGAWGVLDRFEGGYERRAVEVVLADERELVATAYVSASLCSEPPFAWYLEHVVAGARAHGLPESYVAWLAGIRGRTGPGCEI